MKLKKLHRILVKFISNQASTVELDYLEEWIKTNKNDELFANYIKTNYLVEYHMRRFDSENLLAKLLSEIAKEKKGFKVKRMHRRAKHLLVAAVITVIFSSIYFLKESSFSKKVETTPIIVNNGKEPGTDKALLTLEDGSTVALGKENSYENENVSSDDSEIVYQSGEQNSKSIVYNYLTIPAAGQFHIVLSDKTEVWLNSKSQLKYPVQFVAGETREVELIYGEAYFNVSSSKLNNGSKFKVLNQSQEIEVLGTQFNIKAYSDESNVYTTLVEGKVSVSSSDVNKLLQPNEQSVLNLDNNSLQISTVNVYNEISWKDGVFSFQRKPLVEIMKVLSRWYDVEVVFENKELEEVGFNGVLDKNQDIKEILDIIKSYKVIEDYEFTGKTIKLK